MRLALRNIVHDRLRFFLANGGIAFSAFLMMFQGSLVAGLERAASRVIDSIDSDLWVMPGSVQTFDFAPPLRSDYSAIVRGVDGVARCGNWLLDWCSGNVLTPRRKTIVVSGSEAGLPGSFPFDGRFGSVAKPRSCRFSDAFANRIAAA